MTLHEVDLAATRICKEVDENANVIFGARLDPTLDGSMRVAVIATGLWWWSPIASMLFIGAGLMAAGIGLIRE